MFNMSRTKILFLCLMAVFSDIKNIDASENNPKEITVLTNQVAYDDQGYKTAMVQSNRNLKEGIPFDIIDVNNAQKAFSGRLGKSEKVEDWSDETRYNKIDFSALKKTGTFKIQLKVDGKTYESYNFKIGTKALGTITIPAILGFFQHQRANSPEELGADKQLLLYGSDKRINLTGGWCDASGDVSKYFSHLAYTNFMLPQQIPMVTWSMMNTVERIPDLTSKLNIQDALKDEALYGADYIMRSLSDEGYFYMTVFSYFKKDPGERRVVGLLADSKTTSDYQCSWREGGGMGIAALARASGWKRNRDFTSDQYLAGAERAFAHLIANSTKYADDGKDNVIDDYCALMGSTELWLATGKSVYRDEARKRARNLRKRLSPAGYFIADDGQRPFWHAADAGLPVVALVRYLDAEKNAVYRKEALSTIKTALDYNLKVTAQVVNPFGYARQSFLFRGKVQNGFFIPHENESGWWWQGEDARLGSLVSAAIFGGRLVYPGKGVYGVKPELAKYANNLVSWILGKNPYNMCMMYGHGQVNVPYMAAMYGHGSGKGGISNGITGKNGSADGTGIDFKVEDNGNEWRWSEQWIPHTGWFLQAITAMSLD